MCKWEKKYNELNKRYEDLAFKVIINKLKPSKYDMCIDVNFNILIYPEGVVLDDFIELNIVPYLKKELKKLNICKK